MVLLPGSGLSEAGRGQSRPSATPSECDQGAGPGWNKNRTREGVVESSRSTQVLGVAMRVTEIST